MEEYRIKNRPPFISILVKENTNSGDTINVFHTLRVLEVIN